MTATTLDLERAARDRYVTAHVANDCDGCIADGDAWTPAQLCPVHGEACEQWWDALNRRMRRLFPLTYATTAA